VETFKPFVEGKSNHMALAAANRLRLTQKEITTHYLYTEGLALEKPT
jgi:hypothetical protein